MIHIYHIADDSGFSIRTSLLADEPFPECHVFAIVAVLDTRYNIRRWTMLSFGGQEFFLQKYKKRAMVK